jgi:hypothetical protein
MLAANRPVEVERPSQGGLSCPPGASRNARALPLETDVYTLSPTMGRVTEAEFYLKDGAPDTIRTCDLHLRRVALYPAELRAHLTLPSPTGLCRSMDSALQLSKPQPARWIATP